MLTISILTKNELIITYKNVERYIFSGSDTISIQIKEDQFDKYFFKDINGIIIKRKGAKNGKKAER